MNSDFQMANAPESKDSPPSESRLMIELFVYVSREKPCSFGIAALLLGRTKGRLGPKNADAQIVFHGRKR